MDEKIVVDDPSDSVDLSDTISRFVAEIGEDRARGLVEEIAALEHLPEDDVTFPGPGDRVGRYRIVRPIAHGGMGIVFEAEQTEPVTRRVALKLIRRGGATRRAIDRFIVEQQTLARLEHENIARFYDAGFDSQQRPFFVMELVSGNTLTDFADEHRLSIPARLELFLRICGAVQFAHQKGILHRDLKPANLLVSTRDGVPIPRVIDFGLSLAAPQDEVEGGPPAEFEIVGTPEFMSPEQWFDPDMGVDTRTDVYALGVVLYRLITGHLPWTTEQLAKRLPEQLAERRCSQWVPPSERVANSSGGDDEARRFSTTKKLLIRELRGDLDAIVAKTLAGRREDRYGTVAELIADLERHRDLLPIHAAPSTLRERAVKFVRRNLAATVGGSLVLLTLCAGLVVSTHYWLRADEALAFALDRESQTRRVRDYLENLLSSPYAQEYDVADPSIGQIVAHHEASLRQAFAGLPLGEAQIRVVFARIFLRIDESDRSLQQFESALARLDEARPQLRNDERDLADDVERISTLGRIDALIALSRPDEALALLDARFESHRSMEAPERSQLLRSRARATEALGRSEEAIALLDSELRAIVASNSGRSGAYEATLLAEELCRLLLRNERPRDARAVALQIAETSGETSPRRNLCTAYLLGVTALRCGDLVTAARHLEPAEKNATRTFSDHHPRTFEILEGLRELYAARNGEDDAARIAQLDERLRNAKPANSAK